jgi:hypothetical protein
MRRLLGRWLCRLGRHDWRYYIGHDFGAGLSTAVVARCRRRCGIPDELIEVVRG